MYMFIDINNDSAQFYMHIISLHIYMYTVTCTCIYYTLLRLHVHNWTHVYII